MLQDKILVKFAKNMDSAHFCFFVWNRLLATDFDEDEIYDLI